MSDTPSPTSDLRHFYQTSEPYVAGLLARDRAFFESFCSLVQRFCGNAGTVLEIGSGGGQAASRLATHGLTVVGMDVSHLFLARARTERRSDESRIRLVAGDGAQLPFAAERFDLVCLHDVVEHIAEQDALWTEVVRVLKPNGHVVVVGPNLLSPLNTLLLSLRALRQGRVRHPYWMLTVRYALTTLRKIWLGDSARVYRVVRVRPVMHSDEDACYLASPIDVRRTLERNGCKVIRYQRDGHTRVGRAFKVLCRSFAPSIWIVAIKPSAGGQSQ
jgi:SAM-dependent methyltransferase